MKGHNLAFVQELWNLVWLLIEMCFIYTILF